MAGVGFEARVFEHENRVRREGLSSRRAASASVASKLAGLADELRRGRKPEAVNPGADGVEDGRPPPFRQLA
jgi:hypothetical protein